jgi:hypothetical protein
MSINRDKTDKTNKKTQTTSRQETALLSDILPLPDPRFKGRIGNTYADSEADPCGSCE